jgi:ABC-type glycerol-3-phosphate transport system substrate-binding protein
MMSFSKWLAVVPVAALVLTACGGEDVADEPDVTEEETDDEVERLETFFPTA